MQMVILLHAVITTNIMDNKYWQDLISAIQSQGNIRVT